MKEQASEAKWLAQEIKAERARRRNSLPMCTPERRCTMVHAHTGKPCRGARVRREDGTYALTCKFHGGRGPKTPEAELKSLQQFERFLLARLKGVREKIELVQARLLLRIGDVRPRD